MLTGICVLAGCAGIPKPPSPDEYRLSAQSIPAGSFGKEAFSVPKPFNEVMAAVRPSFENCYSGITAGMAVREVGPASNRAQVNVKGPGKAELIHYMNGYIVGMVELEAAGNSTSVTVLGNEAAPIARGVKAWTSGDPSCPIAVFGVF